MKDTAGSGHDKTRANDADRTALTQDAPRVLDTLEARTASIVALLAQLVRIPSRGGIDPTTPILECIEQWFAQHAPNMPRTRIVSRGGEPLGLYTEVRGSAATPVHASSHSSDKACGHAPYYVLNATLDTAGFGDEAAWTQPPLGARIVDGWLYGRGAADSKAGAALFAHLLVALSQRTSEFAGRIGLLLDLDEHTGRFGGARAFFDEFVDHQTDRLADTTVKFDSVANRTTGDAPASCPDGVLIGYPGHERIMVGARGCLRAKLVVHGVAAHSGSGSSRGLNAAVRGGALAIALHDMPLPDIDDATFDRHAQLSVTGIEAGDGGFAAVPDRCELKIDIRLTPRFDAKLARSLIADAIRAHDIAYASSPANKLLTDVEWIEGWPAYRVSDKHPMLGALCKAAQRTFGAVPRREVAGPSNIGNYLASLAIPALCGFGPRGEQLHASDERVELASIAPVYRIYEDAMLELLRR
ncbi:M20/M25/M40 family metallo-hydrolase [Paraburkholderia sp. SARCC-3016]|uniref:M20 family metallopeptidase n=1 Tax=Paraburkholderia sp. SARCC-3016 TaxID=3058611 RepID=UPI002808DCA0|nr:M20/M25/M40 family metallo-hydrolase [Paraburkholderia sp. SARCC-3016]MDQ7977505.1 M20/M25/M40 family metallo-hydrolase [Paraburkholderia sp. SARCC-3016]